MKMRKPVKRILLGITIFLGITLIVAGIYIINFLNATKSMIPSETIAINDSVWSIKDRFVNAYLFKGKSTYVLIDAGISINRFRKELAKTGIKPEQIITLLLTHSDGDHIGATGLFKNATIYMHTNEEQMINGTTGKTKYFKAKWNYGKYYLLDGNDTLSIDGLKIRLIHTPGHTPGSSCYIVGNDYIVTGDNLVLTDGKYEHFIERFNMDTPKQEESLQFLPSPSSFKYILTGHHGIFRTE